MKVICEKCSKEFDVNVQEKYLGAMYTEIFYMCTECNCKYVVCVINNKCRDLKRRIHINNTKELKNEFKKELDRINGRWN